MRHWLAVKIARLAFRLLGFNPANVVVIAHESWGADDAARWGVRAFYSTPDTPGDVCIMFPQGGRAAFDAAVNAQPAAQVAGD